jgi:hypothetical protein
MGELPQSEAYYTVKRQLFSAENENFSQKATTGVGFMTDNIQVRQAVAITNTKNTRRFQSAI